MYNKEIYEQIRNVTCPKQKLREYCQRLSEEKFDVDEPFAKYYRLAAIEQALDAYLQGRVDAKYLANWMCVYNWIINGGFKVHSAMPHTMLDVLRFEISDWLDGLSFFDGDEEFYDLEEWRTTFRSLDAAYGNLQDWTCEMSVDVLYDTENDGEFTFLFVNEKDKTYLVFTADYDGQDKFTIPFLSQEEMTEKIRSIRKTHRELPTRLTGDKPMV